MNIDTVSYWNKTEKTMGYPPLTENREVDILIIGSGITGITCAYCLAGEGAAPLVIEAGGLCDGTTGNTTGKVTIQHDNIYSKISEKHGMEFAKLYAQSQTSALDFVRHTVEIESIDCQLAENTAYLYVNTEQEMAQLKKEYEIALKLGIEAELIQNPAFPFQPLGMLAYQHQYVFHPVRYVSALARAAVRKGAQIYCSTKAIKVEDGDVKTVTCENGAVIKAKHLVQATQYPIYDGLNVFYTRLYAKRNYGIAVRAKRDWPDGSFINLGEPTRSIRAHVEDGQRILIVVGEAHPTGRGGDDMQGHFDNLIMYADDLAGVEEVLARWSAQDYDTPDMIPYIGRLARGSTIYAATGYKKWGLSTGTLAGNMISDLIVKGKCEYEELYSRSRSDYAKGLGTAITEVGGSVWELIKSKLERTEEIEELHPGEGRVITYDGHKAGIYRDGEDNVIILDISCTHLTTEVNFNSAEKTWDCPAHGGRYSADGRLLEGPPKNCLKVLFTGKYSELNKK